MHYLSCYEERPELPDRNAECPLTFSKTEGEKYFFFVQLDRLDWFLNIQSSHFARTLKKTSHWPLLERSNWKTGRLNLDKFAHCKQ